MANVTQLLAHMVQQGDTFVPNECIITLDGDVVTSAIKHNIARTEEHAEYVVYVDNGEQYWVSETTALGEIKVYSVIAEYSSDIEC